MDVIHIKIGYLITDNKSSPVEGEEGSDVVEVRSVGVNATDVRTAASYDQGTRLGIASVA